ncbi:unnamed protein product [Ectocarpus sp. 12 AP-2014]
MGRYTDTQRSPLLDRIEGSPTSSKQTADNVRCRSHNTNTSCRQKRGETCPPKHCCGLMELSERQPAPCGASFLRATKKHTKRKKAGPGRGKGNKTWQAQKGLQIYPRVPYSPPPASTTPQVLPASSHRDREKSSCPPRQRTSSPRAARGRCRAKSAKQTAQLLCKTEEPLGKGGRPPKTK